MAFYLKSKNLDLGEQNDLNVVLNTKDCEKLGVREGETVMIGIGDVELYADVIESDTEVREGEIGLFEEIWQEYKVKPEHTIFVDIPTVSESLTAISKKLRGEHLTEDELALIMEDIGSRKLQETEIAFFISTFFNPGFNDDEILWMTEGMAKSGDILSFKDIRGNGDLVVDKHSIGGVAGKGVTPIIVPILVAGGLVCPNTSTRAITSPAGTSDILEVVMPVALEKEKILEVVKETGGCLFWGGSLDISPADDVIITVERSLRIQEFQKLLVSIVAKKISMGVSNILIDLPFGKGTKVEDPDDADMLEREFKKLFKKVGIKCETIKRKIDGPDGRCIGPALEIAEALKVLQGDDDRCLELEQTVIDMAVILFEATDTVEEGEGKVFARELLTSKKALEKFWEIAFAQGATERVLAKDIKKANFIHDMVAESSGEVKRIDNMKLVNIARAVGNPKIKEAGIYIHKMPGEKFERGDVLMSIYATTESRLEKGKEAIHEDLFTFK
jgi:AMP phosphorylase